MTICNDDKGLKPLVDWLSIGVLKFWSPSIPLTKGEEESSPPFTRGAGGISSSLFRFWSPSIPLTKGEEESSPPFTRGAGGISSSLWPPKVNLRCFLNLLDLQAFQIGFRIFRIELHAIEESLDTARSTLRNVSLLTDRLSCFLPHIFTVYLID